MTPKIVHGARAKVYIVDPTTGSSRIIGSISNISYGLTLDVAPAPILGRYSVPTTEYVGMDVVSFTASGWRIIGHDAHKEMGVPFLQDLLFQDTIEIGVIDRQTEAQGGDPRMVRIKNVRMTGWASGHATRALSEITMTGVGTIIESESGPMVEHPTATQLP